MLARFVHSYWPARNGNVTMAVITISRGSFSGGRMLGERLAAKLGYRCVDRDAMVERAAASGVSAQELLDALLTAPNLLERLRHTRYKYLALLQAALAEEVQSGNVVYHGNAGHLLLQGGGPVLCARVIAPREFRIAMAMGALRRSRDEAIAYVERVDEERRQWTRYLYGVEWEDISIYDVIINLEQLGIEQACEILAGMGKRRCFEATTECQEQMENLVLASRVKARLALVEATAHLEFEVAAAGGRVTIQANLSSPQEIVDARRIAESTPGVRSVDLGMAA